MTCKRVFQLSIILFLWTINACAVRGGEQQARLQKLSGLVCQDRDTGLTWQIQPDKILLDSESEAQQHISDTNLAGYTDWRLPTYDELYILHDALEIYKSNDCHIKQEVSVWYVDDKGDVKAGFWYTDPTCGGVDYTFIKKKKGYLRAVRP